MDSENLAIQSYKLRATLEMLVGLENNSLAQLKSEFSALNFLDGTVLGKCMQRHRHQELICFLNTVERAVPAGRVIHVILDNYAAHKHEKVL